MIELLYEYKQTLRQTKKLRDQLNESKQTPKDEEDLDQYNHMISDLQYIIEWIERGRQPYSRRGIDRREVYRRLVFMDEESMSVLGRPLNDHEPSPELNQFDRERLEDALSALNKKEKDIYLMNKVEQISYERIAEMLGVHKSTVQTYIQRAEKKMVEQTESSLFCVSDG
ncbi:sigma factor-like helix-turn-helix DNA-binding protein [Halobacillus aidingensis]|uniref:RNA polymerase sigma-70 factor, ECF subfamily n=1 Tax=Halobacillus aidingensis TaxID=240303 RepID=A0A1H0MHY6_HALAD|nr:sigma factor-like helix-turn-helix DNA-binding protein [Halobacillus aidingensis]SDO79750.1 RNA polymerase sigma-70 factor, ECF subfamily [Halobacillus aidingensis]